MPVARSISSQTLSNWVLIPVQLARWQRIDNGWGLSGGDTCREIDMPPRLMWFDQDWSLARCHRAILSNFFYILRGDHVNDPIPTYEEVFGLTQGPREPLREGFDRIGETSSPFIVNVVNDDTNSWQGGYQQPNKHSPMPV